MAWSTIADTEIAAYQPISARLLRKFRDRDRAVRRLVLGGWVQGVSDKISVTGDTGGAWSSALETFQVYVPGYVVGDNGTRLVVVPDIEAVQAGTGSTTVEARLLHSADNSGSSGTVSVSSPGSLKSKKTALVLDFTPTADAINNITVQFIVTTNATITGQGVFYIPKERASNYLIEAP